jgi:uncharacterized protein YcfJ
MNKILMALAMAVAVLPIAAPVSADPPRRGHSQSHRPSQAHRPGNNNLYDRNGRYREPRRMGRNDRAWRGRDGRYYCRRDNGTTGLIIGGGVGALAGHEIAGNGDQTLGAIIGGVAGGLLGREVDRGGMKCR